MRKDMNQICRSLQRTSVHLGMGLLVSSSRVLLLSDHFFIIFVVFAGGGLPRRFFATVLVNKPAEPLRHRDRRKFGRPAKTFNLAAN
jgi:hypothetical protein